MKVVALTTLVGRDKDGNKVETPPGGSTDLPDADAKDLIARGFAAAAGPVSASPESAREAVLARLLDGSIPEITAQLPELAIAALERLRELEVGGKTRKGVLAAIDEAIEAASNPPAAGGGPDGN